MTSQINLRYFDDFAIGDMLTTANRRITSDDINAFATLSGDHNPLHTDEAFATTGPYGSRIAHGLLVQAIATGLAIDKAGLNGSALGLRHVSCKFSAAVYADDSLHVQLQVTEKKLIPRLEGGNIVVNFRVINQDQLAVQKGTWQILVKSKPTEGDRAPSVGGSSDDG